MKNWKTTTAGFFLVAVAMVHAFFPQTLSIDWPAVTLLLLGIILCFANKVYALLPYVKRLKVGEAEIELQEKLNDLRANVQQLAEEPTERTEEPGDGNRDPADESDGIESKILELASKDKEAALIRLSIEIEKGLAVLCSRAGLRASSAGWRKAVDALTRATAIEPALANAIIEFRDVRNEVIHSGLRRPVRQHILTRAIDDGLVILRHLRAREEADGAKSEKHQ